MGRPHRLPPGRRAPVGARAQRGGRPRTRPRERRPPRRTPVRRSRTLLLVVVALALLVAPLVAEAQPALARLAMLLTGSPILTFASRERPVKDITWEGTATELLNKLNEVAD